LQPFAAAVNAGVLSVMCSYNRVNKVFACENNYTLALLKQQLNFSGFVVSGESFILFSSLFSHFSKIGVLYIRLFLLLSLALMLR
jgi:hypothetical protein